MDLVFGLEELCFDLFNSYNPVIGMLGLIGLIVFLPLFLVYGTFVKDPDEFKPVKKKKKVK